MSYELAIDLAREGRLYPGVILHGKDAAKRNEAALELARTLLCERESAARPCSARSACRQCSRIKLPGGTTFHPDFQFLERDLKTSTSVDAVKTALQAIQYSPFEARGQVLVVSSAETLSPSAANALLKSLEEPPTRAPRHFLLLTPAATDLLETLRSRCLALYLGPPDVDEDPDLVEGVQNRFSAAVRDWYGEQAGIHLQTASAALLEVDDFTDPRALRPWSRAARVVTDTAVDLEPGSARSELLELAHLLLEAPEMRMRSIAAARIIEGLVSKTLG